MKREKDAAASLPPKFIFPNEIPGTSQRHRLDYLKQGAAAFSLLPDSVKRPAADYVFLEQVQAVIVARLSEDSFRVEHLALALGQSRATLYRRFDTLLDTSPSDLIWQLRLIEAAHLLSSGTETVSEVAYSVGFKGVSHFCRRFKAEFGASPLAYIAQSGN